MNFSLVKIKKSDLAEFKKDMQEAFQNWKPPAVWTCQVKVDSKNHQLLKPLFGSILDRGFVIKFVWQSFVIKVMNILFNERGYTLDGF